LYYYDIATLRKRPEDKIMNLKSRAEVLDTLALLADQIILIADNEYIVKYPKLKCEDLASRAETCARLVCHLEAWP
jgi:hypothetical protein